MDTIEKAAAKLSSTARPESVQFDTGGDGVGDVTHGRLESPKPADVLALSERLAAGGFLLSNGENVQQIEEYRRIKRPLLMKVDEKAEGKKAPNLIMLTSSMPGEGKTFNSINLAVSIAMELDRTVLLIDADVHKPAASTLLGIIDRPGLTDVLVSDGLKVADVLIKTDVPKVTLMSVGQSRQNANELLASSSMARLMNELAQRYSDRIVIIDTPPMLVTNEAAILANLVGQVVVVVEAENTRQSALEEALSAIDIDHINVGLILNKGRISSGKSDYYGGEYGYPGRG